MCCICSSREKGGCSGEFMFSQSAHLRSQTKPSTQCCPDQCCINTSVLNTNLLVFSLIRRRFSATSQNRQQAGQDVCGCQPGSGRRRSGRRNNREGTEFPGGSQVLLHFHFYCPTQHFLSELCHTNTFKKIKEAVNLQIVLNTLFFFTL